MKFGYARCQECDAPTIGGIEIATGVCEMCVAESVTGREWKGNTPSAGDDTSPVPPYDAFAE